MLLFFLALLASVHADQSLLDATNCPSGYSGINGTDDCFRIYNIAKAFTDAESYCQQDGGHLASIHNAQEMLGLNDILGTASALIGIKCSTVSTCTWSDGTPYDYQNFIYGQPTLEYGSCAHLYTYDDKFYSWNCATPMNSFLCRIKGGSVDPSCSAGYTQIGDSCVAVKLVPRSAYDAEAECALEGGHLASVHDFQTNNFFTNLLFNANLTQNAHIGLRYDTNNGFSWTDKTQYDFRNWATPEFPNSHFGLCTQLLVTDEFGFPGTWTNIPCDTRLPYICRKDQGVSPTYAPLTCPSMQYFEDRGTVYSPGFPQSVPHNLHCEYLLAAELGSTLTVSFPYFSIDDYSSLTLYDGMSVNYAMAVLSGEGSGLTFTTHQNIMKMVFVSSSMAAGVGWEASFITNGVATTRVPQPSPAVTTTLKPSPLPTIASTVVYPTTVNSNCAAQTLHADVQVNSPGFPYGYPRNANCLYFISGQPGKRLMVDFEYINTKKNVDYVIIRDGAFADSPEIGRVSGLTKQNTLRYVSTNNYVTLQFISDGTKGETGWTATADAIN